MRSEEATRKEPIRRRVVNNNARVRCSRGRTRSVEARHSACAMTIPKTSVPEMQRPPAADTTQLAPMPIWAIGIIALLTAVNAAWRATRLRPAASGSPSLERTQSVSPLPEDKPVGRATLLAEIPERGWKYILWHVYEGVTEARILLVAAGVTFYLILGLFPGIAALVSIYGLFVDPQTMVNHLDIVTGVAPGGAADVLREQLTRLGQQTSTTLAGC